MGEGQLSTGLFFSAKCFGQLSSFNRGKFRPGLISTGHILTTKVYHNSLVVGQGSTVGTGITGLLNTYITSNLIVFKL